MRLSGVFALIFVVLFVNGDKGFGPGDQKWGFVNVRKGAHMFWWLHYTTAKVSNPTNRPLILFLMGGPGGSSTGHGNFLYVGLQDEKLNSRPHSWVKDFNVLFVDCPVGSGFSYVENLQYLANTNMEVAEDLLVLMKEFYSKVPQFKKVPMYIYGHGYGGKMGADFARLLNKAIQNKEIDASLAALSTGNAWLHPIINTLAYSNYLYQVSLIDEAGLKNLIQQTEYVEQMYKDKLYYQATREWIRTLNLIYCLTDGIDFGNILTKMPKTAKIDDEKFEKYVAERLTDSQDTDDLYSLMNNDVKKALGIKKDIVWGCQATYVFENLYVDFMIPVTNTIEHLLNTTKIKIHVCNGNLIPIANTPGQIDMINSLRWPNANSFKNAKRETIWVNKTMEGYKKEGGGLTFYWFNAAGSEFINENTAVTWEFLSSMTGV